MIRSFGLSYELVEASHDKILPPEFNLKSLYIMVRSFGDHALNLISLIHYSLSDKTLARKAANLLGDKTVLLLCHGLPNSLTNVSEIASKISCSVYFISAEDNKTNKSPTYTARAVPQHIQSGLSYLFSYSDNPSPMTLLMAVRAALIPALK